MTSYVTERLSPEQHRAASCDGKHAYALFSEAEKDATRRRRRRFKLNIYRCRHCHAWHVGGKK